MEEALKVFKDDNPTIKDIFSKYTDPNTRAEQWDKICTEGARLVDTYSWACPTPLSLSILSNFSPLIEIGCGSNAHWGRKLRELGVDVRCYDLDVEEGGRIEGRGKRRKIGEMEGGEVESPFSALLGGPEVLLDPENSKRNLFLCFPDEDLHPEHPKASPLGVECLDYFQGTYVIHVGELFGDSVSLDQAPFGRSSSMEFQCQLSRDYHCLLRASLPRWPHEGTTISVWKRTEVCELHFGEEEDGKASGGEGVVVNKGEGGEEVEEVEEEVGDDDDDKMTFRAIPEDERLPTDVAAPCLAHLLKR